MNKNRNIFIIIGIIVVAAFSRLIPHPLNFAPLAGMALFGGYYFEKKWQSYFTIAASWWLSDLVLNNVIYSRYFTKFTWLSTSYITIAISLLVIILISKWLIKKIGIQSVAIASLLSSVSFFLITNFGAFLELYPKTANGLAAAYTAGLPYFKNTIFGDLVYSVLIFGIYQLFFAQKMSKVFSEK